MSTPTDAPFALLPPELYTHILSFIPLPSLSTTTLSLTRALPHSPVPQYHLFTHVHLTRPGQLQLFHRRLRGKDGEDARKYVKEFEIREWKFDPDILINTLELLPRIRSMHCFIGHNCAPEHIAEIFLRQPRPELEELVLRFRTWTDRANYLPFLKGSYFDSTFEALARLPPPHLHHLSITQDVPTRDLFDHPDESSEPSHHPPTSILQLTPALKRNFAPPIVLFSTMCLTTLTKSPSIQASLTHLRLRFPQRNILAALTPLPGLQYLDLSTTTVGPHDLPQLLARVPHAAHVVLDHCGTLSGGGREAAVDTCREVGRMCAMWGVGAAREKEKAAREWLAQRKARQDEEEAATQAAGPATAPAQAAPTRRAKKGRKGLATATISLRDPSTSTSTSTPTPPASSLRLSSLPKIHILPPLPRLLTLSLGTSDHTLTPELRAEWKAQFSDGWAEGRRRVGEFARRHRPREGVRVARIIYAQDDSDDDDDDDDEETEGWTKLGLKQVSEREWEAYCSLANATSPSEPIFCTVADCEAPARRGFGGGGGGKGGDTGVHEEGCGHMVGREVWREEGLVGRERA